MKPLRPTPRTSALSLLLVALCYWPAQAQPPGEQLIDKVTAAYRDIDQYDVTMRLQLRETRERWTHTRQTEIFFVFDRSANHLFMDMPYQRVAVDGSHFRYKAQQFPGRHVEIPIGSDPLDVFRIFQQVLTPAYPIYPVIQPDLAFLLSDDPLDSLVFLGDNAAGKPVTLPPDENDPHNRPRIQVALPQILATLTINPNTYLIDKAVFDFDTASMGDRIVTTMAYIMDFTIHSTNEPIAGDRFAFDTTGSIASPSMEHMMASGSNAPHPLTDRPTPELVLPDIDGNEYDLANEDAKVIVLDFWATWCPPCVAGLPELQAVYDWAQAEGKPVAIYAVNQGETVDEVKAFWADKGLSLPVLMDENFVTAQAYMVNGIPQTVIIAHGKVQHVHVGFAPGIGERMKAEIEALLK